jgi:polysaccharide biosynthesis protein PslG
MASDRSRTRYMLLVLLLLAGCSVPPTPAPTRDPACAPLGAELEYGANVFMLGRDTRRITKLATTASFGWIRQQVHWHDLEGERGRYVWAPLDQVVRQAQASRLQIMLSVVRTPPWVRADGGLPDSPGERQSFATFLETMAARYRGQVAAYQIWNEPNLAVENGGAPATPARYLAALQAAYPAIKASDRCALVVAAAPAANNGDVPARATSDLTFLEQLYQGSPGAFIRHADIVALHPGGGPHSPRARWQPGQERTSAAYFRHIERARELIVRYGDGRPIWITEVGWNVERVEGAPLPVGEREQADYLVGALQATRASYPWIRAVFVWNLNFAVGAPAGDEKRGFGILRSNWAPRPAYIALQHYLGAQGGAP